MPPKTVFSKEAIVEAGFQVLRKSGLKGLTARNLARQLKSSIMPVYSSFGSMQEFEKEVVGRGKALLLQYAAKAYTELLFLNMGVGIAKFARDEPALYRAMFLERADFKPIIEELLADLCENMRKDPKFADMPKRERMALLRTMWIFTHGLATLICVGVSEITSDEQIVAALGKTGKIVACAALEAHREKVEAFRQMPAGRRQKDKNNG